MAVRTVQDANGGVSRYGPYTKGFSMPRKKRSKPSIPSLRQCLKGIIKAKERATGDAWSELHGIESRLRHHLDKSSK